MCKFIGFIPQNKQERPKFQNLHICTFANLQIEFAKIMQSFYPRNCFCGDKSTCPRMLKIKATGDSVHIYNLAGEK